MIFAEKLARHPDFSESLVTANGNGVHSSISRSPQPSKPAPQAQKKPLFELLENVEEEKIDYLWVNRIPRGKATLFDGDPGLGKSYVALALASALSKGEALPFDREPEAPLRSLIISAEDGPGDTIKPRLRSLGADMNMIAIPSRDMAPSSITANAIDSILTQWPAALTVIDPILAYAGKRNTDRASDVRDLLGPLALVAEKHKTALVLIRHLNKSTQTKALYRGQGSIDFAAVCRSAFIFAQDSDNPARRLMAHSKCSVAALQPTIEFFIDEKGFSWGGKTSDSADDALGAGEPQKARESVQLERAEVFLQDALGAGPVPSKQLMEKAQQAGISRRTLWRAKDTLNIKAAKGRGSLAAEWLWQLPI